VSACTTSRRTPLHAAVARRREEDGAAMVRALLDAGAAPNAADKHRVRPLHLAVAVDVVELLLAHGARLDAVDSRGCGGRCVLFGGRVD
jgi:ankyrin repeat protein